MKMRPFDAALTLLASAVICGGVAVTAAPIWGSTGITSPAVAPPSTADLAGTAPPTALFIGDSYTSGTDLAENSYACRAAARMGWTCALSGIPGTGYISGGPPNRFVVNEYIGETTSFSERIPELDARYDPDYVVLDGGRNDGFAPAEDVYEAMVHTLGEVRRTWPEATIVFVRPRTLADPSGNIGFDDASMARLRDEPAAEGVLFVDPIHDGFAGTETSPILLEDGLHPNSRGDRELSAALVSALQSLGLSATP